MIPDKIHLEVVTPERRVFERDVDEVVLPGAQGSFGVLPGHAPMLTGLSAGVAECRGSFGQEVLALSGGFAEVRADRVTVMAETCELQAEIDRQRAESKVSVLEAELKQTESDPDLVRMRMMKHLARLEASRR